MSDIEKNLEALVQVLDKAQKDMQKAVANRQQLETQLQENKMVQEEFKFLKEDAVVYKLIGPALVKQDTNESIQNVNKRIEYIANEIKRTETQIADCQKLMETKRAEGMKLQQQLQQRK